MNRKIFFKFVTIFWVGAFIPYSITDIKFWLFAIPFTVFYLLGEYGDTDDE